MRIIAGEFRGRVLLGPEGRATRPITDRVKQSVFDILTPYIEGAVVYDCFAGTGSMGLECLSRGAAHATFFEMDRSALLRLKRNIDAVGVGGRSTLVSADIFGHLRADNSAPDPRPISNLKSQMADLVFLDPPYRFLRDRCDALRELAGTLADRRLAPDGFVVFRHDARDAMELPPLKVVDVRVYGSMAVEFLQRQ
jgi:16S rRNA (guanine966-N2)-methyltransferase